MFSFAFLLGLYANCILLLGLANLYQTPVLLVFTLFYLFFSVIFWKKFDEQLDSKAIRDEIRMLFIRYPLWSLGIALAICIMLIGVLSPELAFDALWYHLTLPKLYLSFGGIRYIPGGLLYYSTLPKVGEMFYTASLSFGNEILAHLVHFIFALLVTVAVYCITKKYASQKIAIIAVAIFLSNIVVLWEATTAYVDLIRAFFEIMALWGIIEYFEKKNNKWLIESAFLYGLALETKLVAVFSLPIFLAALFLFGFKSLKGRISDIGIFIFLSLLVSLSWFVFSYIHTGNPIYPLLSNYPIKLGQDTLSFPNTITDLITIFINASDPVSPIYLMLFPLIFLVRKNITKKEPMILWLSLIALLCWTVTPKTGGGRFLIPYLPLFSIMLGIVLMKAQKINLLYQFSLFSIAMVLFTSIFYRGAAEIRNLPVILGIEPKQTFLVKHLNFSYGDFYDIDHNLVKLTHGKTVLLYGFHNLYYMDVPFIDSSYVKRGDSFSYIATQNTQLPKRFFYWQPIYFDQKTKMTLYSMGQDWVY
ncbi:hypothetical protein BH09PAT1_BH09PAT1_3900 [soil metagenome]